MGSIWSSLPEGDGRAVLITGCDTGFGDELAIALHAKSFSVFAACLTREAADRHTQAGRHGFVLDVTSATDRASTVEMLSRMLLPTEKPRGPRGLYALVNNAGIALGTLMDWTSEADFRHVMEVNFTAPTLLAKQLLPLLHAFTFGQISDLTDKRGKVVADISKITTATASGDFPVVASSTWRRLPYGRARVVNITSISSRVPAPGMGPYTASKHALRAMSDVMRWEFAAHGVDVVEVEPGFHATPLVLGAHSIAGRAFRLLPPPVQEAYGGVEKMDRTTAATRASVNRVSDPPLRVVRVLSEILSTRRPAARYVRSHWLTWVALFIFEFLPTAWSDVVLGLATPSFFPRRGLVPPVYSVAQ
eukprot:TRINITY_DN35391_c0_g1_i1.p1 TRINITY_DN35391_c0_g1~~TRINITY_DN35391_c0_g1_i1.p1  ORF type:complete len:362 (+),score=33.27 TRINITY_DN35391_c0_g1_i1:46-1131(+)